MNYIKLMRPKHYIKNFLIFLPIIFSGKMFSNLENIFQLFLGFILFCLTSSIIYIINDIVDAPKDRLHEKKKNRPIASGVISEKRAIIFSCVLFIIICLISIYLFILINSYTAIICLAIYFVLNLLYSLKLKNYPIIDVTILASGFLIRTIYGGILAKVVISNWLYLTVLSMAFFLGLGKRRNESMKYGSKSNTRDVLQSYNKEFLDKNMYMCLGLTIVFYALWAIDENTILNIGKNLLIWTVPLVILICMRYSFNIECGEEGDPVEVLLNDKILIILLILYILFMLYIYL